MSAMKKEYISPGIEMLDMQLDTPILAFSSDNPAVEDFEVGDGKWE